MKGIGKQVILLLIVLEKHRPRDPATEFSCVKSSLVPTPAPLPRTTTKSLSSKRNVDNDELSAFLERDEMHSLDDIVRNLANNTKIITFQTPNGLMVQSSDYLEGTCVARFNVNIKNDFSFEAFHCGIKCTIKPLSSNRIHILQKWSTVEEAIRFLDMIEINNKKDVLHQQMVSMKSTCVGEKKYNLESIIRAFQYFATSRATYKILRNDYQLPSIQLLTRLTSKVKNIEDDIFLKNIFTNLKQKEKTCILLIDEVYVKPMLQYHGGSMFGQASLFSFCFKLVKTCHRRYF